jgi:hypothetical protein
MTYATANATMSGGFAVGGIAPSAYRPAEPARPHVTHETYIHAVRDVLMAVHPNPVTRERIGAVKLVYGAGAGTGARGVTYFGTWQNGHPTPLDVAEICAFGEENALQVAGTTTHELAHVLAGHKAGHGPEWKAAAADLGLTRAEAAGQAYAWDDFTTAVRERIQALPEPTDGTPVRPGLGGNGPRVMYPGFRTRGPRPCTLGIGTRGGRSRGPGSGSRLRLWQCSCGVKVRVASDDFRATCERCATSFNRKG